jgi:tRNA(Ile)-lysidine synthase
VAVAVSGGADSLALAYLAAHWGRPLALIVDHGLRPEAATEASETAARLAGLGVEWRILTLRGLRRGAARARQARYAALTEAAREAGFVDLLVAHHVRDQAETVLARRLSQSGAAGLAAMPAVAEAHDVRVVRPLLGVAPGRLRATLAAAGLDWVEDPSNQDPSALRARLRRELDDPEGGGGETAALAEAAAQAGARRAAAEAAIAAVLAERVSIRPEGFALLGPGALPAAALSALIRALSGRAYPPASAAVARLAADPRPAVLGGVRMLAAGRFGAGLLLVREAAAMAAPVRAEPGALWDGRFRLGDAAALPGGATVCATMGALGPDAARLRRLSGLPAAVMVTLPALRLHGVLAAVPHIGYGWPQFCARMVFSPASQAAGAPFVPAGRGMRTAPTGPMFHGAATAAG